LLSKQQITLGGYFILPHPVVCWCRPLFSGHFTAQAVVADNAPRRSVWLANVPWCHCGEVYWADVASAVQSPTARLRHVTTYHRVSACLCSMFTNQNLKYTSVQGAVKWL